MQQLAPARLTLLGCVAILATQAAAVALVLQTGGRGEPRLRAVAVAAAITGSGALAGWLVARGSRGGTAAKAAAGGLAATALRLIPPLVALAWISASQPELAKAGAGGLLVGFYLTMLALSILLHIVEGRSEPPQGSSQDTI